MWSNEPAYISLYGKREQIIPRESALSFESIARQRDIRFTAGQSTITVLHGGIYYMNCTFDLHQPAQFTVFINGVPDQATVNGINHGATKLTLQVMLNLKKGDVVTIVNHTSAIAGGTVTVPMDSGGLIPGQGVNVRLNMWKIFDLDAEPHHVTIAPKHHSDSDVDCDGKFELLAKKNHH